MKFHWKVLSWMGAGLVTGLVLQAATEGPAWSGASWSQGPSGAVVERAQGPAEKAGLEPGIEIVAVVRGKDTPSESRVETPSPEAMEGAVAASANGEVLWLERTDGETEILALGLDPSSPRAQWMKPLEFVGDIFLTLLRMLIVPLVFSSIVCGVAGVGSGRDLGRLGGKAFGYYISTSLLAIAIGQVLVSVLRPGDGAQLGLSPVASDALAPDVSFLDQLKAMVPSNIFASLGQNGAMLQMIFFALIFGYAITKTPAPHGPRVQDLFASVFAVVMRLAEGILKLIPYGVFALLAKVVATTGLAVFKPLLLYMLTVTLALAFHGLVTLPLILKWVGGVSPLRWFKAMSPALITAFSTSSSSVTLPMTLETVEKRGRVSNKVTSFTLPLGATINMDGTALYECIGVIFLAQYYAALNPDYTLGLSQQGLVVLMALLASIGAAGIPSAGLVMMLTILSALGLPLEGAALLLAVDRPLDMLRTTINVWSDSCGACVIARSEGETGPLSAGEAPPEAAGTPASP